MDTKSAIDTLVDNKFSEDDIDATFQGLRQHIDSLVSEGKSEEEIDSIISQTKILSPSGEKISLFGKPTTPSTTKQFSVSPSTSAAASQVLKQDSTPKEETGFQQFTRTLPEALFRAVPFPNVFRAINDPKYRTMESLAHPLPEIITDPINRILDAIRKKDPSAAKDIEAAMASTPFISGSLPRISNVVNRAIDAVRGENAAIAPLRDVSGQALTKPLTRAESAVIAKSGAISPTAAASELITAPSSIKNIPNITGKGQAVRNISPALIKQQELIDTAKAARDYAVKTNNHTLFDSSNKILDNFKIPYEQRNVTPEIARANSDAIINSAKQLKEQANQAGDVKTYDIANDLINRNGILKLDDTFTPNKSSDPIVNKVLKSEVADSTADLNIIANRFNNDLISSDFGFKDFQQLDRITKARYKEATSEPTIINGKRESERPYSTGRGNLSEKEALSKIDVPEFKAEEYAVGDALIKRAVNEGVDGLAPLKDDVRSYMSIPESEKIKSAQIPSNNLLGEIRKADLEIQSNAILRPFWNIAAYVEAKTGLPLFNEMFYKGKINYNKMMDFQLAEQAKIDKIYGKYSRPYNKYIEGRERISDILEEIKTYDPQSNIVTFIDSTGKELTADLNIAIRNKKWNPQEAEIAAKLRDYYDTATARGAPLKASSYIDYYNPRRHENSADRRAQYFDRFRDNEKAFFSFHRTGADATQPWIRDSKTLVERYIREWGVVNNMLGWQNQIARPLLETVKKWENDPLKGLSTDKPARYVEKYIRDMMGIARDNASDVNYTAYKIIRDHIEPFAPKIAKDIYTALSKDRTAEIASSRLMGLQYKSLLGYRPLKMIRNFNQRSLALPLMPHGGFSIINGMKKIKTKEGQDKVLSSGILGYVGDMVDKGFSDTWKSPMRGWEAIEKGNRGSIYLPIHDGVIEAFNKGKKYSEVAKEFHLNLYHEVVQKKFKELYESGRVGDVRELGVVDNAAHFLGDNAQGMTQYWYDKGSGIELFKQGPIWKQAGAFSSYSFFTANYLSNLLKASYKNPADLARVMKMIAYITLVDNMIFNATGINFQSNPLTNMPSQIATGPIPTGLYGAFQLITGKYNEIMGNILKDRDEQYSKFQQSEGRRKLINSLKAVIGAPASASIDLYNYLNPKEKPVSIKP